MGCLAALASVEDSQVYALAFSRRLTTVRCPQCDAETPDDQWNCVECRINLYEAHQHYAELARIRERQGLTGGASAPSFLVAAHRRELSERAERGLVGMNKVREIARRIMRGDASQRS
jgi:hypothetical protein